MEARWSACSRSNRIRFIQYYLRCDYSATQSCHPPSGLTCATSSSSFSPVTRRQTVFERNAESTKRPACSTWSYPANRVPSPFLASVSTRSISTDSAKDSEPKPRGSYRGLRQSPDLRPAGSDSSSDRTRDTSSALPHFLQNRALDLLRLCMQDRPARASFRTARRMRRQVDCLSCRRGTAWL